MTRPLMLFAAGFGTRMGALTQDRPKPLIEVAGRALIDHALDLANAAKTPRIVVNAHYKADQIATHLEMTDVILSHETRIRETGGGLKQALPLLGTGPVMTMNSDAVWRGPNPVTLLQDAWDDAKMDALLLCIPTDQARGHLGSGDFTLAATGQLTRGPGLIYSGVQILRTDDLADFEDQSFSLNVVWDRMQARGRLFGLTYPGLWCDVGRPENIALAEAMVSDV